MLSIHFSLAEFTRSDTARAMGNSNRPTPQHEKNLAATARGMELVRSFLGGYPIRITSGYRNPEVNKAVGGVANSDHALGWAVDFQVPGFGNPYQVAKALSKSGIKFDQLIHERKPNGAWWVHISFNPRMRGQLLTYNGKSYTPGIHEVRF